MALAEVINITYRCIIISTMLAVIPYPFLLVAAVRCRRLALAMPPSRVAFIKYSTEEGTSCSTTAKDHSLFHLAVEVATPENSMISIFFTLTPLSGSMSDELLSVMWMVPKHIQGADHGIPSQGYRQALLFSSVAMITSRSMISKIVWVCIAISQHID